jgi:hypothetical protein
MKMVARADVLILGGPATRADEMQGRVPGGSGLSRFQVGAGSGFPAPHFAAAVTGMRRRGVERGVRAVVCRVASRSGPVEWMGKGV